MFDRRRDRSISGLLILVVPHKALHDDDALEKFLPPGQTPAAWADAVRFLHRSIARLSVPFYFHVLSRIMFQTIPILPMSFPRILQEFFQTRILKLFGSKKHKILLLKFLRVFKHFNSQNVSIYSLLHLKNYVNLNLFHSNTRGLVRRSTIISDFQKKKRIINRLQIFMHLQAILRFDYKTYRRCYKRLI